MKKLNGFVSGCMLLAFLSFSSPLPATASGIPVIDIAGLAQSIQQLLQMIEQVMALKEQVETAKKQLETAKDELSSISNVRNMGGIIGSIYDNDMEVDYEDALEAADILSSNEFDLTDTAAELFDRQNHAAGRWKSRSDKFIDQAIERFNELEKLVQKVNAAPEQKDILDLQARIQAEHALLQNEAIKLQMMESQAKAERALLDQQQQQALINMAGNPEDYRF